MLPPPYQQVPSTFVNGALLKPLELSAGKSAPTSGLAQRLAPTGQPISERILKDKQKHIAVEDCYKGAKIPKSNGHTA